MLSLIVALAALQSAPEAAAPPSVPVVQDVAFAPMPRNERVYAYLGPVGPYYPERAARLEKDGEAILDCTAMADGALKRCRVVSETPGDLNFSDAAMLMAHRGRIRAASPIAGEQPVRVRVPFQRGAPVTVAPKRKKQEEGGAR